MSDQKPAGVAPLNASMDLESMEREMRQIYEELKQCEGSEGGKEVYDLEASSTALVKSSRSATQMLAQIMGDLGPMLKDPMMQNHPLLAKYLAEEQQDKTNEDTTALPAATDLKKSENDSEKATKIEAGSFGGEVEEKRDGQGEDVEVDKLIQLFVSGKKEKEKVTSSEPKPLASSGVGELSARSTAADQPTSPPHSPSELRKEEPPAGSASPGRTTRQARESLRKETPTRKSRNPQMDKEMERIRRAVEEKKAQRQREIMGERNSAERAPSKDTAPANLSDSGNNRTTTESETALTPTPMSNDKSAPSTAAADLVRPEPMPAAVDSTSGAVPTATQLQPMPSSTVSPSEQAPIPVPTPIAQPAQPQPTAGPVQLGTLPLLRSISMKAVAMPAPIMAMPVPVPMPMPVPVPMSVPVPMEEDIGAEDTSSRSSNESPIDVSGAELSGEKKETKAAFSPRCTFGPGKSTATVKHREESEEGARDQGAKADEERNEETRKVGRHKADTISSSWLHAAPPKEKVKADHRKSLLDRRLASIKPALPLQTTSRGEAIASATTTTTPGSTTKSSEHAVPFDGKATAATLRAGSQGKEGDVMDEVKKKVDSGEEDEEEEEEEDVEEEEGKEEDEASEYEDGGSDDEDVKKSLNKSTSGDLKKSVKPLSKSAGDVPLNSMISTSSGNGVEEDTRARSKSSKDDQQSSSAVSSQPAQAKKDESTSATKRAAGEESGTGGVKFSRFGSASLVSAKRIYKLAEGNNTLGRGDVQIVLKAASVSRKHATITLKNGTAVIRDLNSTHGTRVNDKVVTGKAPLAVGDNIKLGSIRLTFQVEAPIIEGVISKRSPAFHKSWQKRYCVLKKRQRDIVKLYYYRSKENRLPQGSVSMEQVVSVTDDENGGSPNVFKIKTIMRVFEFQAKDEEERNMWMQALREASGKTAQRMEADRKERQRAVVAGAPASASTSSRSAGADEDDDESEHEEEEDTSDRRKQTTALPADMADLLQNHKAKGAAATSHNSSSSSSDDDDDDDEDAGEATVKQEALNGIAKVGSMF